MPREVTVASQLYIKRDGKEIPHKLMAQLVEATVEQHAYLPHMVTLRFQDPQLELLDSTTFDLGDTMAVSAKTSEGKIVALFDGEVTALEPEFAKGMLATYVVRGYDKAHRLFRQMKSCAFVNQKDSDIAKKVAQGIGLKAEVDDTRLVYDHVFQDNQSDLAFLMERAWRIGFECFVQGDSLIFRQPRNTESGVTLAWGEDLVAFYPRLTVAEQVDEVLVKGWNEAEQKAIVGRAENGRLYPRTQSYQNGAEVARQEFGRGKKIVVNQPVVSQAEANILAQARLDEVSGAFLQAEGEAFRRPDIRAGRVVVLKNLGQRLSGKYLVTAVTHSYTQLGLKSYFQVRGSRTGTILEEMMQQQPTSRWSGVVPAVVTNNSDPQKLGRVKVQFPWLDEQVESDWARLVGLGVVNGGGLTAVPTVGQEVLVAFEQGDINQPFVLGGLWNGQHTPPAEVANTNDGEANKVMTWRTASGHRVTLHDTSDNKIEIETAGGHQLVLDDKTGTVTLKSSKDLAIEADANVKMKAGGNLDIEATGKVTIKGQMINLN